MEPQKVGDKANALLREPLKKASKIGIAKVVSKRRQYLAAVKPQDQLLVLRLMHFADELIDTGQFKVAERDVGKKDLQKVSLGFDALCTIDCTAFAASSPIMARRGGQS